MVTRFVPAGYQPQWTGESTAERVRRAIDGLGDLMDGYEFHYPQELSEENLDEVREALGDHDVYCVATGLHLDSRFGRGGLVSPDPETRAEAVRRTVAAADFAGRIGAQFIVWPGIEGYNYPFQTPYAESWAWLLDGIGAAAERCAEHGVLVFLEHKNSEPAMKILMRNVGMTLHVIHKLRGRGLDNVKVNMDWQHLIMNGENLAEYAAMLAAEGLLGHQHANSGWGTFDDDNMVGATAFMETLELGLNDVPDDERPQLWQPQEALVRSLDRLDAGRQPVPRAVACPELVGAARVRRRGHKDEGPGPAPQARRELLHLHGR